MNNFNFETLFGVEGKTALVTGSSQGMGKEIAKILADCGATVWAHGSRMSEKLTAAAEYIGTDKIATADLTDKSAADTLYAQTGAVDILILNASIQYKRQWDEYSDGEVYNQIQCNLTSSYYMMKKYTPDMKNKKWGRIITLGSVNQYNNHPELLLYGTTKAAQMKLVQSTAKALAPYGITVNNIAPGAISTPRNAQALSDPEFNQKVTDSIPMGYIGDPKDMNGAVLMLCGNAGSYITGSETVIDGGMRL